MSPRVPCLVSIAASAVLGACAPEPASSVEVGRTLVEVVDLARAMALEHAIVDLTTHVEPTASPSQMAAAVRADAAARVPCADMTEVGATGVRVDFGPGGCTLGGRGYVGAVEVEFSEPGVDVRLATITYDDLASAGVTLAGTTQSTWGTSDTRRLISELRLAASDDRQLEIQSDRMVRTYRGALQIDGWHRWQTLMGRWEMELAGWELVRGEPVPGRGLARVSTPFEHEVVLDFVGAGAQDPGGMDGMLVRANGGRRDRVFSVAVDGTVVDLGDD